MIEQIGANIVQWISGGAVIAWVIWHTLDHRKHINGRKLVDTETCQLRSKALKAELKTYLLEQLDEREKK